MSVFFLLLLQLLAHHAQRNGRSEEDGAECTEDDTQNHGEGERADAVAAEEEDAEQHEQRGA